MIIRLIWVLLLLLPSHLLGDEPSSRDDQQNYDEPSDELRQDKIDDPKKKNDLGSSAVVGVEEQSHNITNQYTVVKHDENVGGEVESSYNATNKTSNSRDFSGPGVSLEISDYDTAELNYDIAAQPGKEYTAPPKEEAYVTAKSSRGKIDHSQAEFMLQSIMEAAHAYDDVSIEDSIEGEWAADQLKMVKLTTTKKPEVLNYTEYSDELEFIGRGINKIKLPPREDLLHRCRCTCQGTQQICRTDKSESCYNLCTRRCKSEAHTLYPDGSCRNIRRCVCLATEEISPICSKFKLDDSKMTFLNLRLLQCHNLCRDEYVFLHRGRCNDTDEFYGLYL